MNTPLDYGRRPVARDNGGIRTGGQTSAAAPDVAFRDVLSAALESTGTGQDELARKIGRSGAAVNQWLRKGDMPDLAVVFKIEDALDLRLGTLVRHVNPEVWLIIETKSRPLGNSWESLPFKRKLHEVLLEAPIDDMERRIVRETLERFIDYHAATAHGGPETRP